MSFTNEDDRWDNFANARDALIAAAHRDRPATMALLARYDAKKLPDLRVRDLIPFTTDCREIQAQPAPPPPSPFVYLSEVNCGHIVERYTNKVKYFVSSSYNGTGHRVLTTLQGGIPKPDVSQEELVLDLGPATAAVADFDRHELFAMGNAVDDVKGYKDCGTSFSIDGARLIEALRLRGLRVVRK